MVRWVAVVSLCATGCAEESSGGGGAFVPFAVGSLEPAAGTHGAWVGVEELDTHGQEVEPECGWRRTLGGELEGEACAACQFAVQITDVQAPDSDGACDPDADGLLRAGARLWFVPRKGEAGVGAVLVDGGEGAEELGTGVFDGSILSWRRYVSAPEASS